MTLLAVLREALRPPAGAGASCLACAHFDGDPVAFERELPGAAALSSGQASVRARDGLCRRHDIVASGHSRCADWVS